MTLDQVWALAKRWYRGRMAPGFRGITADQAIAIFRALGLTDDFWTIAPI